MPVPPSEPAIDLAARSPRAYRSLLVLGGLSLLSGAAIGLIGAGFRFGLEEADRIRAAVLGWGHGVSAFLIVPAIGACAGMTALAAWLVRRWSPQATGSGIPHVECVLHGELPPASLWLVPVKFVGGILAMGAGLALGREGPSVQIGASVAHLTGVLFRRNQPECLVLLAAGAGAGLATAFNAPIAGAVFVLEELYRRFDTRMTIATLGTSAGAIAVSRAFLGNSPDFHASLPDYEGAGIVPIHLAMGLLAGLVGVAYNRTVLGTLYVTDRSRRLPVEARAALIGAGVGVLAWFAPHLVGGGGPLTQRALDAADAVWAVALVFGLRFVLGPVCYAARTPGGLFAPMLVLGAQGGLLFGKAGEAAFPGMFPDPRSLAVVGMAAFFSAVVRAPVTGIILVTEMTGSFTLLLPLLSACFSAMLLPTLLEEPPVYDSLREATLRVEKQAGAARE